MILCWNWYIQLFNWCCYTRNHPKYQWYSAKIDSLSHTFQKGNSIPMLSHWDWAEWLLVMARHFHTMIYTRRVAETLEVSMVRAWKWYPLSSTSFTDQSGSNKKYFNSGKEKTQNYIAKCMVGYRMIQLLAIQSCKNAISKRIWG